MQQSMPVEAWYITTMTNAEKFGAVHSHFNLIVSAALKPLHRQASLCGSCLRERLGHSCSEHFPRRISKTFIITSRSERRAGNIKQFESNWVACRSRSNCKHWITWKSPIRHLYGIWKSLFSLWCFAPKRSAAKFGRYACNQTSWFGARASLTVNTSESFILPVRVSILLLCKRLELAFALPRLLTTRSRAATRWYWTAI
jgi:hypothetical protein